MRKLPRRRARAALGLALLLALSVALVENAFFHTDDGCQVETHCLACRWVHGATVVPAPAAVTPVTRLAVAGDVFVSVAITRGESRRISTPSRAPPLA